MTTDSESANEDEALSAWIAEEQARRAQWAAGPTVEEISEWTARHGHAYDTEREKASRAEAWASEEGARRRAWLNGPTPEEVRRWRAEKERVESCRQAIEKIREASRLGVDAWSELAESVIKNSQVYYVDEVAKWLGRALEFTGKTYHGPRSKSRVPY